MADLNRIISGYQEAIDAANYAEALVFDTEQNSGDDYTLVWSTSYEGGYPPIS